MSYIQQFFTSRDNNANAETFVGQQGRLWWDPTTNQIYSSDGNTPGGIPLVGGGGGNGTPGGLNGQVQFNQAGDFGGSANLTFNSATGALTAVSVVGNGAGLTNITGANVTGTVANATSADSATSAGTVTTNAQPNITSVGTLIGVTSTGNISTTGNVVGNYILGNGSQLTGIAASYSNANVATFLAAFGSNVISTTGNVTGGNLLTGGVVEFAGGSRLRPIGANLDIVAGAGSYVNLITSDDSSYMGVDNAGGYIVTAGGTWRFDTSGALTLPGATAGENIATQSGYITVGNLLIGQGGALFNSNNDSWALYGNLSDPGTTIFIPSNADAGNGLALYFENQISNVEIRSGGTWAFNTDGTTTFPGNIINSNSNPITLWSTNSSSLLWRSPTGGGPGSPIQTTVSADNGNATISVSTGTLSIRNIETWTFDTAGNTTFPDATVQTTAYPGTSTSFSVSGNVTGGNVLTGGLVSATGNITGGNLNATGLSLSGNVVSAINSTANIITTGNIRAGNLIGSNLTATRIPFVGTGGVITDSIVMYTDQPNQLLYVGGGGAYIGGTGGFGTVNATRHEGSTMTATGNITGGNIRTGGSVSATGNIGAGGNPNYYGFATTTKAITVVAPTSGYAAVDVVGSAGNAGSVNFGNVGTRHASIDTDSTRTLYLNVNVLGTGNAVSQAVAIYPNLNASFSNAISATANVTGGNLLTGGLISATGNITGGNVTTTGAVYSNFNTNTANTGSFNATGGNTKGGTGYLDFLVAQNTSGGATNPYKWLRVNPTGGLEVINSAYTTNLFNLTDAGALTIPGPFNIGGKQAVNGPAFSAYASAVLQTITPGSQQKVLFQTEEFDTNSNYANSIFTPTVEGYYQLNAEVRLDGASGTGEMMIVIWKNGAGYKRGTNQQGTQIAANFWAMQVSSVVYANGTTDYFEIYVQQGSGGNVSVTAVNDPSITWFNGCMLRGA